MQGSSGPRQPRPAGDCDVGCVEALSGRLEASSAGGSGTSLPVATPSKLPDLRPAERTTIPWSSQIFWFSDFSIQAAFSRSSMMACSRSALEGSASSTSSWTVRIVSTVA